MQSDALSALPSTKKKIQGDIGETTSYVLSELHLYNSILRDFSLHLSQIFTFRLQELFNPLHWIPWKSFAGLDLLEHR